LGFCPTGVSPSTKLRRFVIAGIPS
jgi:hypothetical protein